MIYLVRAYRLRAIADPTVASGSTGRKGIETAEQIGIGPSFDWCLALQPAGARTSPGLQLFIDAQINCSLMHKPMVMAYTYLYYWETAL